LVEAAAMDAVAGRQTLALVIRAAIMERADEALLPAVYQEVGLPGTRLGMLTLYCFAM